MSTFGMMVKTWLTGSERPGLRRRALTWRSVISESLDKSTVSTGGKSGDSGEFGVVFFMPELLARFKKAPVSCAQAGLVGGYT